MSTIDTTQYISTQQAADELGMNRIFIRDEIRRGNLPALRISRAKYRIKKTDWEAYKESKKV